jgi:hypothetical protein
VNDVGWCVVIALLLFVVYMYNNLGVFCGS